MLRAAGPWGTMASARDANSDGSGAALSKGGRFMDVTLGLLLRAIVCLGCSCSSSDEEVVSYCSKSMFVDGRCCYCCFVFATK